MKQLTEFFQEASGSLSMMRLCLFLVVTGSLAVWAWLCLHKGELIDPAGVALLQGGAFGAKAAQAYGEKTS